MIFRYLKSFAYSYFLHLSIPAFIKHLWGTYCVSWEVSLKTPYNGRAVGNMGKFARGPTGENLKYLAKQSGLFPSSKGDSLKLS